jgi:hypothetical protein
MHGLHPAAVRPDRRDLLYTGPGAGSCLPAMEMTVDVMPDRPKLLFLSLVTAANGVLPEMRERGEGTILAGFCGRVVQGSPFMSGSAPAQEAARNCLYSLRGKSRARGSLSA